MTFVIQVSRSVVIWPRTVLCIMSSCENEFSWTVVNVISERVQCDGRSVGNVIRLLDDDNTIPFIVRYRKEQTNFMEPDKVREIKDELGKLR